MDAYACRAVQNAEEQVHNCVLGDHCIVLDPLDSFSLRLLSFALLAEIRPSSG